LFFAFEAVAIVYTLMSIVIPGVGVSAECCPEHDQVSPPCLPSIVASAQTDRSGDDLAVRRNKPERRKAAPIPSSIALRKGVNRKAAS
jgi:hypothetical protein